MRHGRNKMNDEEFFIMFILLLMVLAFILSPSK